MNELRPHGRELLRAARRERTPAPLERERLLSELLAAADPGPASGSAATRRRLPRAARLLLLVVLALAIAFSLFAVGRIGQR